MSEKPECTGLCFACENEECVKDADRDEVKE